MHPYSKIKKNKKRDTCDCGFQNSPTSKSQLIPMYRLFPLQELKKLPFHIQFKSLGLAISSCVL